MDTMSDLDWMVDGLSMDIDTLTDLEWLTEGWRLKLANAALKFRLELREEGIEKACENLHKDIIFSKLFICQNQTAFI